MGCVCKTKVHNYFIFLLLVIEFSKCPFGGDVKSESKSAPAAEEPAEEEVPEMEAESEESEVELDMEGMLYIINLRRLYIVVIKTNILKIREILEFLPKSTCIFI